MSRPYDDIDQLSINTLRTLALDAVEQAKSGHPGLPMGAAPMAHVLWTRYLRHNPADPSWPGRDRFVLSAGHGCMLLYALLHLTGYDLSLDELKHFRQWGSLTPGHPERGHTAGVEATTGPLGAGHRERRRDGDRRQAPGGALRRGGRLPRIRARLRRRPDGGRLGRGLVARRPSGPRQPRLPLRRQPRDHRRRHPARLHGGPRGPLRRLRVAHAHGRGRKRPGRDRRRHRRGDRPRRPADLHLGEDDHRLRLRRRRHVAGPLRRARRRAAGRDQAGPGVRSGAVLLHPRPGLGALPRGAGARRRHRGRVEAGGRPDSRAGDPRARDRAVRRRREADGNPRGLGQGDRPARRPGAVARRRLGRPHALQQHQARGLGGLRARELRRPLPAFRRPRARHERDLERPRGVGPSSLCGHVLQLPRLRQAGRAAVGALAAARRLDLHARLGRAGRGRADPPAD